MGTRNWFWIVPLLLLFAAGCKPDSMDSRIAFFRKHREVFESYVSRVKRDEIGHDQRGYALLKLFADNDIKQVTRQGDCVEIVFSFMPTDAVPLYIYSPQGLQGLPEKYRTGGPEGTKWAYWKLVPIDDKWFYCEWDQ